jgi:hypothetical protein
MSFSSIIIKNIKYNSTRYVSFYFVNIFVIAILFMYGSLLYNSKVVSGSAEMQAIQHSVQLGLFACTLFSLCFITYTNISFLKNRGKEFGMFLNLGMTRKNLLRMVIVENLLIMIVSLASGIFLAVLLSKLFYMAVNKILEGSGTIISFELNLKTLILSILVYVSIFLINLIFNYIFIKRSSIINLIKSKNKAETGKTNLIFGMLFLVTFVMSLILLPKVISKEIVLNDKAIYILFALIIISPYFIIGSFLTIVKKLASFIPNFYNSNILVLGNLSHKFLGYRSVLYMLSIFLILALTFVGLSYGVYATTVDSTRENNPYSIQFVEKNSINSVDKNKVIKALESVKGTVTAYDILEFIEVPIFREPINSSDSNKIEFFSKNQSVISESNYNRHMGESINLEKGEALYITKRKNFVEYECTTTTLIDLSDEEVKEIYGPYSGGIININKEDFEKMLQNSTNVILKEEYITEINNVKYANYATNMEFNTGISFVIDDDSYNLLKSKISYTNKLHLINFDGSKKDFNNLLTYMRTVNRLDDSYWEDVNNGYVTDKDRGVIEAYRPTFIEETIRINLNKNGILLFTMIFIGFLFLISCGVVLYYKVLLDVSDESERLVALNRIGITKFETRSLISKELGIIFFTPILLASLIGIYLVKLLTSNLDTNIQNAILGKYFIVLILMILSQYVFYLIGRNKYYDVNELV